MRAALAGDSAAYRILLSELMPLLRQYYLNRLGRDRLADAEDLVQETLVAIHTRRATYDQTRPVTAWAHAIARYKLVDHVRSQRVRLSVPLDDEGGELAGPDEAEPAMARKDLGRILDCLPTQTRRLITEVKLEGRSIAETAALTGLSEASVKTGINRGLRALSARFGGKGDGTRDG
jgi:RNA polymerase sigma-70 factor (ECF subfamily)